MSRRKKFETRRSGKREAVLGDDGGGWKVVGLGLAAGLVILLGVLAFAGGGTAGSGRFQPVVAEAGRVRIPVEAFAGGKARFFSFEGVNFFAMRSSDGVIRAALDSCDTCSDTRRGYRQEGDRMVCNKCDQEFPSDMINVLRGGCNPVPLDRTVEEGQLVLQAADLRSGKGYFR